jgi:3-deoxy-D-manno-octulosonic-acid transferase
LIDSLYSLLYSAALAAAFLITLPYWLLQMLRQQKYRAGLLEKLGSVSTRLRLLAQQEQVIWVHAVSVGEVLAIAGLIEELRRRSPRHKIFVSTTTDTGQALARKRFGEDCVFYFPMDFAFAIRPYLRALHPQMVVIAETEFWPNFMRLAHASGARIAIVNARISDRSWPRYRRFRSLIGKVLAHVDLFLAQTPDDAARLRGIGADPQRVRISGNLKFDIAPLAHSPFVDQLRNSFETHDTAPILVCGSTVEGEEPLLLDVFRQLLPQYPQAVMILAPRHPERFDAVATLLKQSSIGFSRRSAWGGKTNGKTDSESLSGKIFLLDTIGELAAVYALADIAFVGGSLVRRGGHNIIEPALHGAAIVVGNHTENFRDIVKLFQSRDAIRIAPPSQLQQVFSELLADDNQRKALGQRAAETIRSQMGATIRTADALQELLTRP